MSYINQLTLMELSLNSEAYGATSNATFSTDDNGDIILSPSTAGAVYASTNLITPQIQFGSSTGPSITSDSSGNLYTPSTFVTQTIQLSSSSGPVIQTDSAGNINLFPVSGTVNFEGGTAQTISAANNLTIECGSSSSITLSGNTSVSGSTTLGTNSSAISNIQFGTFTLSNISESSGAYVSCGDINLYFTPASLAFGVGLDSTNMGVSIEYATAVQYVPITANSGYSWSCTPSLYLPSGNGSTDCTYTVTWIAIA
jgi:hypothetical protein